MTNFDWLDLFWWFIGFLIFAWGVLGSYATSEALASSVGSCCPPPPPRKIDMTANLKWAA
jgi:hypothetical protein